MSSRKENDSQITASSTKSGQAGITAYQKDSFYSATKAEILRYVRDRVAFERLPTKTRPRATQPKEITIRIPRKRIQARYISLDDIDSFSRVTKVSVRSERLHPYSGNPV